MQEEAGIEIGWIDGWMDGFRDLWMDLWMDGLMDDNYRHVQLRCSCCFASPFGLSHQHALVLFTVQNTFTHWHARKHKHTHYIIQCHCTQLPTHRYFHSLTHSLMVCTSERWHAWRHAWITHAHTHPYPQTRTKCPAAAEKEFRKAARWHIQPHISFMKQQKWSCAERSDAGEWATVWQNMSQCQMCSNVLNQRISPHSCHAVLSSFVLIPHICTI